MKSLATGTWAILVLGVALWSCAHAYVLPVADGGDGPDPSPATVQGRITIIAPDWITVIADRGRRSSAFEITKDTEMFSVYGGAIEPDELAVGQQVRIWEDRQAAPKSGRRRAAVVMFASKDPKDSFPD